ALNHQLMLSSCDGAHDETRLVAFGNRVGQWSIERFVGDVFAAGKESHQRPALERVVFTDSAAQHRVSVLQCSDNCVRRHGSVKIDMHFIANFRQRAEMMWKNDSNHFSVCTSTDRTAGKSRTIGFHESPASDDA